MYTFCILQNQIEMRSLVYFICLYLSSTDYTVLSPYILKNITS